MLAPHAEKRQRLTEKLDREFGAPVCQPLADPNVTEIMVNPDGKVWIETYSHGLVDTASCRDTCQIGHGF